MKKLNLMAAACCLILAISACGGSGSASSPTTPTTPFTPLAEEGQVEKPNPMAMLVAPIAMITGVEPGEDLLGGNTPDNTGDDTLIRVARPQSTTGAAQDGSAIAAQVDTRDVPYGDFVTNYATATAGAVEFEAGAGSASGVPENLFLTEFAYYPTDFADGIIYRKDARKIAVGMRDVDDDGNFGATTIREFTRSSSSRGFVRRYSSPRGIWIDGAFYDNNAFPQNGLALGGDGTSYIGLEGDPVRFFVLQNQHSAIGMWMLPTFGAVDERLEEWGFRTPGELIPGGGRATYGGFAIGGLVDTRETGESCGADCSVITQARYFVQGDAEFTADFSANTIAGGVTLNAYNPDDVFADGTGVGDISQGQIAVTLGELQINSNGEFVTGGNAPDSRRPRLMPGQISANLGVFAGLTAGNEFAGNGRFRRPGWGGRFYGPTADEIAGGVRIQIDEVDSDSNPATDEEIVLRFRFIGNKIESQASDVNSIPSAVIASVVMALDEARATDLAKSTVPSYSETIRGIYSPVEAESGGSDFRTLAGTGNDLVFPVLGSSRAIIRSADGTDYIAARPLDPVTVSVLIDDSDSNPDLWVYEVVATVAATVLTRRYETDGRNPEVARVVSDFQMLLNDADDGTGLASANVSVAVKGAREESAIWVGRGDGRTYTYPVDWYAFETQYSALGMWMETPSGFLGEDDWGFGNWAWNGAIGLQTPASDIPSTGTATYSGVAAGRYLRYDGDTRFMPADRYLVGGKVTLNADFTADGGISGTAVLDAYNVATPTTSSGMVTVQLADSSGGSDSNINGAAFSGDTSIMGTPTSGEAFADLRVNAATSIFSGFFTGPGAEEAVGHVIVDSMDTPRIGSDPYALNFGFLTRRE